MDPVIDEGVAKSIVEAWPPVLSACIDNKGASQLLSWRIQYYNILLSHAVSNNIIAILCA